MLCLRLCADSTYSLKRSEDLPPIGSGDTKPVQSHLRFSGSRNQTSLVERDLYCSLLVQLIKSKVIEIPPHNRLSLARLVYEHDN